MLSCPLCFQLHIFFPHSLALSFSGVNWAVIQLHAAGCCADEMKTRQCFLGPAQQRFWGGVLLSFFSPFQLGARWALMAQPPTWHQRQASPPGWQLLFTWEPLLGFGRGREAAPVSVTQICSLSGDGGEAAAAAADSLSAHRQTSPPSFSHSPTHNSSSLSPWVQPPPGPL